MATIDEIKERAEECMGRDKCLFCSWFRDVWCDRKTFARETLEAIKRLEATQLKWISVEERLPQHGRYLVITRKGASAKVHTATYNDLGWWTHANFGDITHWMPLPEPPEEEET